MPTAQVGVYGMVKPQTLAYQFTMNDTTSTQTNADLQTTSGLSALPYPNPVEPSALTTFLKTVFASNTAADNAFRALGGRIDVRQTGGTAAPVFPSVGWQNINAVPALQFAIAGGASNEVLEVVISMPHSIIQ